MKNRVSVFVVLILAWSSVGGCEFIFPSHHDALDYQPIHEAAQSGNLTKVKELLTKNPLLIEAKDWADLTPLHLAVLHGQQDIVVFLLDKGAKVNSKTSDGVTPLHEAAQTGNLEVVKVLLAHGADIHAVDSKEWTPFDRAEKWQHPDVANFLRQKGG